MVDPKGSGEPEEIRTEQACRQIHTLLDTLALCKQPSGVPFKNGLYFFYEVGEISEHGPRGRIVRVGNHQEDDRLIERLHKHYSPHKSASVFRRLLGGAIMRFENPENPCLAPGPGQGHWERQKGSRCALCKPIEERVSALLCARFKFRCVEIRHRNERDRYERLLIATLAQCSVCVPSENWLGRHAYSSTVRQAGLWNQKYAEGPTLGTEDLELFARIVEATRRPCHEY